MLIQPSAPDFIDNPNGLTSPIALDGTYDPEAAMRQISGTTGVQMCGADSQFLLSQFVTLGKIVKPNECV